MLGSKRVSEGALGTSNETENKATTGPTEARDQRATAHLLGSVVARTMGDLGEVPEVRCARPPGGRPRTVVSGKPLKRRHLPSLFRGCVYSAVLTNAAAPARSAQSAKNFAASTQPSPKTHCIKSTSATLAKCQQSGPLNLLWNPC